MVAAVLQDADYLFANSRQLVSRVSDISGKSCLFMPTNRILPMDEPPKSGLDVQATKLLYVGRLEVVKGIDVLVEAVLGLLRKQTDIILYILGDGSLRTRLEAMVAQESRTGQVVFVGWADPATVTAYLKACDVLVIPSRSEGMPVVYWEAMQAGKPVIVTDVGDMAEYTRTHAVGAVASAGDPASLSGAIGDMAAGRVPVNRESIRRLAGEASLGKAVQTFLDTVGSKANS
jgi:glycosyltransferase involved in cell wall biosynthesis